jgi:hypothetical protein
VIIENDLDRNPWRERANTAKADRAAGTTSLAKNRGAGMSDCLHDLLRRLDAAGVEPRRHGNFVGYLGVRRLTPELRRLAERHEDELRRVLPNSPTPYKHRLSR